MLWFEEVIKVSRTQSCNLQHFILQQLDYCNCALTLYSVCFKNLTEIAVAQKGDAQLMAVFFALFRGDTLTALSSTHSTPTSLSFLL